MAQQHAPFDPETPPRRTRELTVDEVMRMVEAGILTEDDHVELLEGELVIVTPQGPAHANTDARLLARLYRAYADGFVLRPAMPTVSSSTSLPEPDSGVFRGDETTFATRHPRANESVLLVEIASTSLVVDHEKAAIYARAGAPVYWLLDLTNRRLEVHEGPQPDGTYRVVRMLSGDDLVTPPETKLAWRVGDLMP